MYNLLNKHTSGEMIGPIKYYDFVNTYFKPKYEINLHIAYNGKWNYSNKSETDCKQDLIYVLGKYLEQGRFILTYSNEDAVSVLTQRLLYIKDYTRNYDDDNYIDNTYFGVVTYYTTGSDISKNDICYTISSFSFSYICYDINAPYSRFYCTPRRDITVILNTSGVYISYKDVTDEYDSIINRKFI